MKYHIRNTLSIFLLTSILMVVIVVNPLHAAQVSKHVFVLNSFNRGYSWTDNMLRGIDDAFSSSAIKVETYVTFMDMKRIPPTPQYFQQIKELIREGYKGVRFDAVLACDNDAFEFAKKYRDELFPGVPVVFSSINDFDQQMLEGRKDITGTSENTDYTGTIKAALKLLPATKNIVVVTDNTTTGKAHRSAVEKISPDFPQNLGFTYISLADMTMDELAGKLSKLERGSIVLLLQHFKDKDGMSYTVQESTPLLTKSSSVPVFVLADVRIGLGALGGHVVSGYHHGEAAAQMAVKILKGTDVKSIPVLLDSPNKYMFDYGVMQRFKIEEKDLPQGSILINKPISILDKYRPYLYALLCIFILLSGFVAYLLREISRRKKIERSLQVANDKLQEQYEELQMNEEELRIQNDELLSVEEMLRVQINEYEASQKLLKEGNEALSDGEEKLRKLANEQRIILNNSSVGISLLKNRKVQWANPAFDEVFGYEAGTTVSMDTVELYAEKESYNLFGEKAYSALASGEKFSDEMMMKRKDGSHIWCNLVGQAVNPGHPEEGSIWVVIDITERKQAEVENAKLESQLYQAQKIEAVGRLAGGVAHDFNNMLGVILGHAYLVLEETDSTHPFRNSLDEIRKAAERSADLTRQLLAFARKQTIAPKVLDLNETISGMLKMLQRLIGEDIHLTWQPATNVWPIKVEPSQIDQILANLCINARDAISDVGKITIETGNFIIDEAYCNRHRGFETGEYVRLVVSDNGSGMDNETLANIFEPFFTTKGVGKGTGLGLATVYGIAKQNNGFINVYSEPGIGTTFTIYLPRHAADTDIDQVQNERPATPVLRGHETILLVEDESAILNMATMILTRQGYTVLPANTPEQAISLARESTGGINLLMTDVVMPEMNGRDLARNLRSLYPQLKILFMSGYTANVIAHHGVLEENVHFIQKPFSLPDLASKVREVLDETT